MPNKTAIEWTDYTSNPIVPIQGGWGCSKVSPGCDHCYAETLNRRLGNKRDFSGRWTFRLKRKELMDLKTVLRNKAPRRVFMCDMTDLFHSGVPWEWIYEIFQVMCELEQHTFQLLTKRPGRMAYFAQWLEAHGAWWPTNVWAGTSVESQKYAPRLDVLARVPAKVRFVSVEPLLGPVDLKPWLGLDAEVVAHGPLKSEMARALVDVGKAAARKVYGIQWVIAGGESGAKARPMHPDWVRAIRDQCQAAGVPFFFKQWGQWIPVVHPLAHQRGYSNDYHPPLTKYVGVDGRAHEFVTGGPNGHFMRKVGKKAAGAMLDGREWREMPVAAP